MGLGVERLFLGGCDECLGLWLEVDFFEPLEGGGLDL